MVIILALYRILAQFVLRLPWYLCLHPKRLRMSNLESGLTWQQAKEIAEQLLFQKTQKHLNDIEILVLEGSWEGLTYEEIGKRSGYSTEYLNKDIGNQLWKKLSEALGEKLTKKNFKVALERGKTKLQDRIKLPSSLRVSATELPFTEGAVAPSSPFYIERDGIESLGYKTVVKPAALIRIKAPNLMGKTSLIMKLLDHAASENYQTVYLGLNSVNKSVLTNLELFLRWLCLQVSRELKLANQLENYWYTEIFGSNDNCTLYFEEYLLPQINCPLVLGLDDIDRLFSYREVIEDFLGMLRSWHEKGKIADVWRQLRLVVAHSTEVYIPLDINQSPFNAGVPLELTEFDPIQVKSLACFHGLNWNNSEVEKLMKMVCGHPYLIRLGIYEIACGKITLEELLQAAATEAGIYSNHLRRHLQALRQAPELAKALQQVVTSWEPVELDSLQIYKLHSMGLVEQQGNRVVPRCHLYREYFSRVLV
ncbi:AAA-like domain-containing protein [Moorena sp. SIO3B2]|uniref:AAA-like domain-containing protein n=1 Tax=Moorena sp. SIO3B2 TaxID=2607827 RepID=UPI00257BC446|nr:AAA-like domain-containing protein [Moorena sp. SIO3B2]